jgi:hypothetical protein
VPMIVSDGERSSRRRRCGSRSCREAPVVVIVAVRCAQLVAEQVLDIVLVGAQSNSAEFEALNSDSAAPFRSVSLPLSCSL